MHIAKLSEFTAVLDKNDTPPQEAILPSVVQNVSTGEDSPERKSRATLYAAKVPGEKEGFGRNNAAYCLAAALREKFALNESDRLEIMRNWNVKNSPPLDDAELAQAAGNADRYGKKPAGSGYEPPARKIQQHAPDDNLEVVVIGADEIEVEEMTWFWPNRIPAGMYSFIVGDPGSGKSFLSCFLATVASNGGTWPDGTDTIGECEVLMFVSEDHLSKTFIKRLKNAGANLKNIKVFKWLKAKNADEIPFIIQENIHVLTRYLDTRPNCKLVILDPITGYMGEANQNSQADVREALIPIKNIAENKDVTIIGLSHLNKKVDLEMQHRSVGSVAFNAVPRAVWGVCAKPKEEWDGYGDDKERFLFPIKDNLCISPDAIRFEIDGGSVRFGDQITAAECNQAISGKKKGPTKKETAKQMILDILAKSETGGDELLAAVTAQGISDRVAADARRELRAAGKVDTHNPKGEGFKWFLVGSKS